MLTGDYAAPTRPPWLDVMPNTDIELAIEQIGLALEGYEHAHEYDSINMWERFVLSREGRTLRQAGIEFDPNLCSPVIDAVNDRLVITSVTASAGTASDSDASVTATNAVARLQAENELGTRYRAWNRKALRDGDAYMIVWPTADFDPEATHPELTGDVDVEDVATPLGVNVTYADPRQCRMFYDPENPRQKLFFAQTWRQQFPGERGERIRINLFYPDRVEKWVSGLGTKQKNASDFAPYIDPDMDGDNDYPGGGGDTDGDGAQGESWPMQNPYGTVPVFHLRTDFEYGKPEHRNAWSEQAAISKVIEMMMVALEFNAFPQRYALQEPDSLGTQSITEDPFAEHSFADLDRDITDNALSTTTVDAGAITNETGSEFESNPGALQLFKNFKAVGTFEVVDPDGFLEPMRQFAMNISTATSTPLWKFAGVGATAPSGEALKIAEAPLVQKVTDRMGLLAGEWQRMYEFGLKILGITARVSIAWANPSNNDLIEVWNLVEKWIALGMPRAEAFMRAGIPEEQAREWADLYSTTFAEAEYQQGRAKMYLAQADLLTQQAIAARIANGMPEVVAWVDAGFDEATVTGWFDGKEQENSLSRKVAMFQQITQGLQQLGLAVQMDILGKEGANEIIVALFGDLLPEVPAALLQADDDEEEEPTDPAGMPALPAAFPRTPEEGPGLPAGFAQQLPPGTPAMNPIPPQDR